MAIDDDLLHAAVAAAERAIGPRLWDVHPKRRSEVAEAAVRAAQPYLDGTEHPRVEAADGSNC